MIEGYIDMRKHFSVLRDCLDISKITDAKDNHQQGFIPEAP